MFEMLFYPQVEYDIISMVNVGKKKSRRRAPKNQRFPNAFDQMATRVIHDGR